MNNSAKELVDQLHESYKLGGAPLALIVLGAIISIFGSGVEGALDMLPGVDSTLAFLAGTQLVTLGAFLWHEKNKLRNKLQTAMIDTAGKLIESAGNSAKMGSDFQVALDKTLPQLPKIFAEIKKVQGDS